jgi:4-diphosphocytidyl-2-C-methyl-D-erythritol kinase
MVCFPNSKINLGLNIIEKRSDGYHNIETVFYPVQWCDVLEVVEDRSRKTEDKINFSSSGFNIDGDAKNNLCLKAFQLLKKDFRLPSLKMHLHKIIPMGAGLGGGSSDAAFTLKLFNELFHLNLNSEKLKDYAKQIGSDCSFFIDNDPVFASGKGELMENINLSLKGYFILIAKPDAHIFSADAYNMIKPERPKNTIKEIIDLPISEWKTLLKNDFEKLAFEKYPIISNLKNKMYQQGATYSSMSGSGSSVYGIFEKKLFDKNVFIDCIVYEGILAT